MTDSDPPPQGSPQPEPSRKQPPEEPEENYNPFGADWSFGGWPPVFGSDTDDDDDESPGEWQIAAFWYAAFALGLVLVLGLLAAGFALVYIYGKAVAAFVAQPLHSRLFMASFGFLFASTTLTWLKYSRLMIYALIEVVFAMAFGISAIQRLNTNQDWETAFKYGTAIYLLVRGSSNFIDGAKKADLNTKLRARYLRISHWYRLRQKEHIGRV